MPIVLLIRHGQASFGTADYDRLSDLGRRQAEQTGWALRECGLRCPIAVHVSLRRQRETARLALTAAGLSIEPTIDPRWNEYDHLDLVKRYTAQKDALEPRTSREFQVMLDVAIATWIEHEDEGGWPVFAGGIADALRELVDGLDRRQDAVVFTSAGVIATVCADLLGSHAQAVVALNRVAVNGAITKLAIGGSGTSLLTFNEHSHLDAATITYR